MRTTVLITGATGFIGGALTNNLNNNPRYKVIATGRNKQIGNNLITRGITFVAVDLEKELDVINIFKNIDVVFHCAALSSPWGKYSDFYKSNVVATKNIIKACRIQNISRLIHVSTPAIYLGKDDRLNVSENSKLPNRPINAYAKTKLLAEKEVLKSIADWGLPAIIVRPRAVFGPGDNSIMPRIINTLKTGRLPIIGKGDTISDITYIDNVVDALILCAEANNKYVGKTYNITNDEPVVLWNVIITIASSLNLPLPAKTLSKRLALIAANIIEIFYKNLLPNKEPPLTTYAVRLLSQNMTLDISAIKQDLGYHPKVSTEEGITHFLECWNEIRSDRSNSSSK